MQNKIFKKVVKKLTKFLHKYEVEIILATCYAIMRNMQDVSLVVLDIIITIS